MPYAIPSDDTKVGLVCSPSGSLKVDNWGIYASSIVTNVGAGNCYFTVTDGSDGSSDNFENIHCMNVGALASGTDLLFAF